MWGNIQKKLKKIYTEDESKNIIEKVKVEIESLGKGRPESKDKSGCDKVVSAADIALITYADSIVDGSGSKKPLACLSEFIKKFEINKSMSILHILPFFPWDTDRGFSVKDYYMVNPEYGDWDSINDLAGLMDMMFDFVVNHASVDNPMVQGALISRHLSEDDARCKKYSMYKDFVVAYSSEEKPTEDELSNLARPRPNPVLTPYYVIDVNEKLEAVLGEPTDDLDSKTVLGSGFVWTTFSRAKNEDGTEATMQVDMNVKSPAFFVEIIKVILFYESKGARYIRLDAIGYLWKKLGSTSLHEKETHLLIEVICDIIGIAVPDVVTIAEVNEPQDKAKEYLGSKDHKEADIIYQFTHFPLAVYAVLAGDARPYIKWIRTLDELNGKQFITVLGSHDGMGLKPVKGFLTDDERNKLAQMLVDDHKALPNHAFLPGGEKIVYEVCATPWNIINPQDSKESDDLQIKRYLAVVSLGLMLKGIPAFYINGLIGAENYLPDEGLDENRTVNRENLDVDSLFELLGAETSRMGNVLDRISRILTLRASEPVFGSEILETELVEVDNHSVVVYLLKGNKTKDSVLSIVNVSNEVQNIDVRLKKDAVSIGLSSESVPVKDLISGKKYEMVKQKLVLKLAPYDVLWLKGSL